MAYFLRKSKGAPQPSTAFMQGLDSLGPLFSSANESSGAGFGRKLSGGGDHDSGEPLTAEELELLIEAEEIASV